MNLHQKYMTRSDCYTAGRTITPRGIMVHSTATPGVMAAAWFNHWNKSYRAGEIDRQVCVHAFVDDKEVWQYLPWNHRGWHCGGSGNDTHIGFEICEPAGHRYSGGSTMINYDAAKNEAYFRAIWKNAVELCVMLCQKYGLTEKNIICHSEGNKQGIASNHGDVMHWFPKHGENMDTFRAAVKKALEGGSITPPPTTGNFYRVRKSWNDPASQLGAFKEIANARALVDANPGYFVFDENGKKVYPADSGETSSYTVVKGDTLWGIAEKKLGNGSRYPEIKSLNGLTSDTIYSGQVLKIPARDNGSYGPTTYTVVKGDTLWGIAEKKLGNGARYPEIKTLNGLSSNTIHAGQVLKIPK